MSMSDIFGEPVKVDSIPGRRSGPGRESLEPAMKAWLEKLEPGSAYELASPKDAEGNPEGHGLNRVTRLREIAGEGFRIETRVLEGKKNRYRVFATVATAEGAQPEPAKGTAAAKAAAAAKK